MSFLQMTLSGPRHVKDRAFHRYKNLEDRSGEESVTGKIVVITGSNGGLGKVVALQMAKRGAIVVMACRDVIKAENAIKEIKGQVPDAKLTLIRLDLSDMDSVRECAEEIKQKFPHVNILVNNAGIMMSTPALQRTKDGIERHLATNYLGHVLLTMMLLELLQAGAPARIVDVASMAYEGGNMTPDDLNWEKPKSRKFLKLGPYNDSKMLMIYFAKELSRRLQGTRIHVYSLCPGVADTDLLADFPFMARMFLYQVKILIGCSAEQGAANIMHCALSEKTAAETGKVYHYEKRWTRAERATDDEILAQKLWVSTEKLLGVSLDKYLDSLED